MLFPAHFNGCFERDMQSEAATWSQEASVGAFGLYCAVVIVIAKVYYIVLIIFMSMSSV